MVDKITELRPKKGEIYFQCSDCKENGELIKSGYLGAMCPKHNKPLQPSGTLEDLYHQMFKNRVD